MLKRFRSHPYLVPRNNQLFFDFGRKKRDLLYLCFWKINPFVLRKWTIRFRNRFQRFYLFCRTVPNGVGWSSRVVGWDSMKDLVFLRHTPLHKKLILWILALNSFWLARNRLLDFEPCESGTSRGILGSCVTQRGNSRRRFLSYSEAKWSNFWVLNSSKPKECRKNTRSEKKFWDCRENWAQTGSTIQKRHRKRCPLSLGELHEKLNFLDTFE